MNDHAVADHGVEDARARADRAIAADTYARTDHRARRDQRAGADLGSRPDNRQWIDSDAALDPRGGVYLRARRTPARREQRGRPQRGRKQRPRHRDECAIRLIGVDQHGKRAPAPWPRNAAPTGRPRRASMASSSRYFALSKKLRSPGPAASSGAMLWMRRSSGVSARGLARVRPAMSPTVSSRLAGKKSGTAPPYPPARARESGEGVATR